MPDTIPILRFALQRERSKADEHRAVRYPHDVRSRVVTFARARRSAGHAMSTLASDLGLPPNTLARWCSTSPPTMARVEVVTPPVDVPVRGPILVTPSGHRVEGLALEDVAVLLERLG